MNGLTLEQKKVVEDNHNLIYGYLNKKGLKKEAVEDWYGVAAIGLCKAAMSYDEARGASFSTYAYACMEQEFKNALSSNKSIPAGCVVSLEGEIGKNATLVFEEVLADPCEEVDDSNIEAAMRYADKYTSSRDALVIDMIVRQGKTISEASRMFGLSRQTIYDIRGRYAERVRKYMKRHS